MTDVVLYDAKLTTLKIGATITSPTTASSVYTQISDTVSGGVTKWLKDVTISGIDAPMELVNFLGQDSNNFQNQELESKPFNAVRISGTVAVSPVDTDTPIEAVLFGTSGVTLTANSKRYQFGQGSRTKRAVGVEFTNSSNIIHVALNNAYAVRVGDISQSADTHLEAPFEIVALTRDYYVDVETA